MRVSIALAGIAALALAGCGGAAPARRPSTATSATATASAASCTTQAYTWVHGGDDGAANSTDKDAENISRADGAVKSALDSGNGLASALSTLTADASALSADARTALANQPPACIPGADAPYRSAMAGDAQAAQDQLTFASDLSGGKYNGALLAMTAFGNAMIKSGGEVARFGAALKAFIDSR